MKPLFEAILKDLDPHIRECMLMDSDTPKDGGFYKMYELIPDPANTALLWHFARKYKENDHG